MKMTSVCACGTRTQCIMYFPLKNNAGLPKIETRPTVAVNLCLESSDDIDSPNAETNTGIR